MATRAAVAGKTGWQYRAARAILSGFAATGAMTLTLLVAYTVMANLALVLPRTLLGDWFAAMTENTVVDLTRAALPFGITLHLSIGTSLALVYAWIAAPRLPGPDWLRGVLFSLVPWMLSLVFFLPLLGGGLLGLALGAGPLPILGNLILHVVYGATLGIVYGKAGDQEDLRVRTASSTAPAHTRTQTRTEQGYEEGTALGIVAGGLLGGALGGAFGSGLDTLTPGFPDLDPWSYALAGFLAGAAGGALVGSFLGMTPSTDEGLRHRKTASVHHHTDTRQRTALSRRRRPRRTGQRGV